MTAAFVVPGIFLLLACIFVFASVRVPSNDTSGNKFGFGIVAVLFAVGGVIFFVALLQQTKEDKDHENFSNTHWSICHVLIKEGIPSDGAVYTTDCGTINNKDQLEKKNSAQLWRQIPDTGAALFNINADRNIRDVKPVPAK